MKRIDMLVRKIFRISEYLIPFVISILIGITIMAFTSGNFVESLDAFFLKPFLNEYFIGNMLSGSIPLILTGLAAATAFASSVFNLGIEGQVYSGAFASTLIALMLPDQNRWLVWILALFSAFVFGGFIGGISGFLKNRFKVNELISSLLISYSITLFIDYLLENPFLDAGSGLISTATFEDSYMFPKILNPSNLHSGFIIALIVVLIVYVVMKKSTFGFSVNLMGKNTCFSEYAGINTRKLTMTVMILSGGIAASAGMIDVFGVQGRVIRGFSSGYGWNGIAIALIARNNPLLVIPAALFFSYLDAGAATGALFSDLTPEISRIVQASIFYFITASFYFKFDRKDMKI